MSKYSELGTWPLALGIPLLATLAGFGIDAVMHRGNISLAYLLAILIVSLRTSTRPALACAVLSFLLYNFFFTEPRFTLLMTHQEDILTMMLFLVVAGIAGQQAVRLRRELLTLETLSRSQQLQFKLSQQLMRETDVGNVMQCLEQALSEFGYKDVRLLDCDNDSVRPDHLPDAASPITATFDSGYLTVPVVDRDVMVAALIVPQRELDENRQALLESLVQQASVAIAGIRRNEDFRHERLQREREMLRTALLSSVSHDLRTPLASMIGAASSLLDLTESLSTSQQRELQEAILAEAQRLDNYTRNLLELARLEHGEIELTRDWVGVDEILATVIRRIRPTLERRNLSIDIPDGLPSLFLHGTLVEQAVFNVLHNAVKFSPDGSDIALKVRWCGDSILIDVVDSGAGIPADEHQRIFEMFHRAELGDLHSSGTGLGLSISKGMLRAQNADIEVLESSKEGTTFRVTLPVERFASEELT